VQPRRNTLFDEDLARRYAYAAELLRDLLEGNDFYPDVPTKREV
jgi:hypothetical protein